MSGLHPYQTNDVRTPLGRAFCDHDAVYCGHPLYRLPLAECGVLDAIAARAGRDPRLAALRDELAGLLAAPNDAGAAFRDRFSAAYEEASRMACPLWAALLTENHKIAGVSTDYTLTRFDPDVLFALEEEAPGDPVVAGFVKAMLARLAGAGAFVDQTAWRQTFEVYSEALVYRLLRDAGKGRIQVERIPEGEDPTPDFRCTLLTEDAPRRFYIEVKTLDIVHADQRHAEMLDDGMLLRDQVEKRAAAGSRVAIASGEIAPYRKLGTDPGYDPRSLRMSIERLVAKCRQSFKPSQFQLGPTFALASLLRMPLHDHGERPLAPFAYDPARGGACVSGALWNVCLGAVGDPIHRWPEFEGAGTIDGRLQCEGILVGAERLPSPGVIFLRRDREGYRLDAVVDGYWSDGAGWSTSATTEAADILCQAFNDTRNANAHRLSNP
ncbi:MAG: hypothetical protein WAU78_11855 [Roseiarcus sp.]